MNIRTGELPPGPESSNSIEVPRYYWRSTVYDVYTGAGWATSSAPPQTIKANTPLITGLLEGYRPVHLDVEIARPEGRLFWSGILYSADIPFRADWRVRPQSDLFGDQTTLLQSDMFTAATSATSYTAESFVPVVSIKKLRNASTDYPDEIGDRYRFLPNSVPDRVHQLARQIVQGSDNPYDKAKAIETYLRTYYPYDLKVPTPPEGHDVADYFLFELRRGYCDYYATAMVVLARENGLPARFVSGYASGSYDAPNARYVVRELNAHSWAEVYFPEIGWIEFEPTGSQPEIVRPEKEPQTTTAVKPITPASRLLFQFTHGIFLYWLVALGFAMILIILYYAFFERIVFTSIAPVTAITFLYRRYYRMGRPLVGKRVHAETAHEFTNALIDKIKETRSDAKRTKPIRSFEADVNGFTNIYYSTLFSNRSLGKNDAKLALRIWKRLRRFLLLERIRLSILNKTALLLHRI
ncbi:MAG TPA: transglutaminase domain-containing protein, partial [Candidatus Udaeobacter sp.]|nr:transglutaminase domain-containing protein [Candidatus Udaeobacter sp.]